MTRYWYNSALHSTMPLRERDEPSYTLELWKMGEYETLLHVDFWFPSDSARDQIILTNITFFSRISMNTCRYSKKRSLICIANVVLTRRSKKSWDCEWRLGWTTHICTVNSPKYSTQDAEKTSYLNEYWKVFQKKKLDVHCQRHADTTQQERLGLWVKIGVNDSYLHCQLTKKLHWRSSKDLISQGILAGTPKKEAWCALPKSCQQDAARKIGIVSQDWGERLIFALSTNQKTPLEKQKRPHISRNTCRYSKKRSLMCIANVVSTRRSKKDWDCESRLGWTTHICTVNAPKYSTQDSEKTSYLNEYLQVLQKKKLDVHCQCRADKMRQERLGLWVKAVVKNSYLHRQLTKKSDRETEKT